MRRIGGICAAVVLATTSAACGGSDEERAPEAMATKVALTLTWPGVAPWALITYTGAHGARCAALGSITRDGPRVLRAVDKPLATALPAHGRCLDGSSGPVVLEVAQSEGREVQIVGGLAERGVKRLRVAGQTVRPDRHGAFLLIHADGADTLGREYEVLHAGGGSSSYAMPKPRVS